jgi:hypothetical protein
MKARLAIAATLLAGTCGSALPAAAQNEAGHVYGPDPGWAKFRAIGEKAVIEHLIDPESARITWLTGYSQGAFKPFLEARVYGYVACGTVNARNRMGGYTGATTFVVVIDFDRPLFVNVDSRGGGMNAEICEKDIAEGRLLPTPAEVAGASTSGHADTGSDISAAGLSVRAMPDGAYVSAVRPGSIAAAAGLTAGMVVMSVNGIPLAGMGDAMAKVIAAAGSGATVTIVGGKSLTFGGPK